MSHVWHAFILVCLAATGACAFDAAPLVETCNRLATPLGSGWVGPFDPDATSIITANGTACVGATAPASLYWGTAIGSDTFVTLHCTDCETTGTNAIHLVPWLVEPSAVANTVDEYRCVWQPAASVLQLLKVTNGAAGVHLPGSPVTVTSSTGDQLGCEKIGATISAWQSSGGGWSLLLQATDPSPFATVNDPGYVGFLTTTTSMAIDQIGFARAPGPPLSVLYVDNTQSCPGTGSATTPYCSLQLALDHAIPADHIKIRTGTGIYEQYATTTGRQGTATAPITIEPDTGAVFVLRNCNAGAAEASLEILDSDYWIIQGLTFNGAGCATVPSRHALKLQGVTRDITGIQLLNNTFTDWRQTWDAPEGPQVLYVAGCAPGRGCRTPVPMAVGAYHARPWLGPGMSEIQTVSLLAAPVWDEPLRMAQGGGSPVTKAIGAIVQGNSFQNIDRTAIRLIQTQDTRVEGNTITAMRCGRDGTTGPAETVGIHYTDSNTTLTISGNQIQNFTSYLSCPLTLQGIATVAGIWCNAGGGSASANVIERNMIHDLDAGKADLSNAAGTSHSASGIFLEEQCAGTLVKNNVLYDIGTYGIRQAYHAAGGTSHPANAYYHNSLYDMLEPLYFKEGVALVRNNLVSVCRGVCIKNDADAENTLTIDGNLYHDGSTQTTIGQISPGSPLVFTAWQSACNCDAASINADPQLAVTP